VVLAREDTPGDKRLVAYLVSDTDNRPETGDLRQFIRAKLPEYMVPSAFVFLSEFPMTPNRKVNRKALPAPDTSQSKTQRNLVLPRTTTEQKIAGIWAFVLGVEKLDVYDNFFNLGGHSLLATRVISGIREEFHIDLPLRVLFMTPTIADVSEAVDTILWATQPDPPAQNANTGNKDEMEI
jgi:acyl carrier protein